MFHPVDNDDIKLCWLTLRKPWARVRARADGWAVVAPGMMMDHAALRERGILQVP